MIYAACLCLVVCSVLYALPCEPGVMHPSITTSHIYIYTHTQSSTGLEGVQKEIHHIVVNEWERGVDAEQVRVPCSCEAMLPIKWVRLSGAGSDLLTCWFIGWWACWPQDWLKAPLHCKSVARCMHDGGTTPRTLCYTERGADQCG